jgi:hypothetical protein
MQAYRGRMATIAGLILVLPFLSGCGAVSAFMADTMPTWMGGLPEGAPPRPSDPRYPEYERAQRAKAIVPDKTDATKPEVAR